ncbi:MAG: hypothetical protein GY796_33360 [Chloroflexi bacterium]|nr:hypothetical protein [Chloroflexota bacterium]
MNDRDEPEVVIETEAETEAEIEVGTETDTAVSPPTPPPAPVRPTAEFEQQAVRRGCFSIIFGATLGALIGAVLTLAVLSSLNNGSLTYNEADVQLRNQLDDEIVTRQTAVETQSAILSSMATQQAAAQSQLNDTALEVEHVLATSEGDIAGLRVTAVYLETRIAAAGNAADTLNAFLTGLEDVINDLPTAQPEQEQAAKTATATATMTSTPIVAATQTPVSY